MQKAYINSLYEIASKDKQVVSILADSGTDYDELFARELPAQSYNFGIAECNMVAAAAGMASAGKIPFVYTTGAFLAYRAFEFIRDDVCLQDRNVKIVGMGSGLAWSTLGPTHHTTEDISVLRAVPNLTIFSPATPLELQEAVREAYRIKGPVYIRMGMKGEQEFYTEADSVKMFEIAELKKGEQIAFFSTGSILSEVMSASELLSEEGVSSGVYNVNTIKPFHTDQFIEICKENKTIITVEEHNINGGLGAIVSEIIAENGLGCRVIRIGINDVFAKGYGTQQDVRRINGIDAAGICKSVLQRLNGDKTK